MTQIDIPLFDPPFAPSDEDVAKRLFSARPNAAEREQTEIIARDLIRAIRGARHGVGGVEDFLHEFALSTREGLAVMALAESLLRVPDDQTLDRLIADKIAGGDFLHHHALSDALLVQASAFALGVSARLIGETETPQGVVAQLLRRLGAPALRGAARQAMRLMGGHFVFGETIATALARSETSSERRFRHSYDMLGEAARTSVDAARYFDAYAGAIAAIAARAGSDSLPNRPGISVKLSALHPRYEAISRERVLKELAPRLLELARAAKAHDLCFTVDAEEADRLELSLDVIGRVVADPALAGWDGFGLAVQAYQKRASAVIDHVEALASAYGRRFMVRLVKGAYWDSEIKRAQERGLADYPVFTRKAMTDVSYLVCAAQMLAAPRLYPQFATHNAQTAAAILARAGKRDDFEFQRLHGMGEALHEALSARTKAATRVYAPVGPHRDLLAYLVRRLMENGANSSFVARAADPATPEAELIADPFETIGAPEFVRHARLKLPRDLYRPLRANSSGVEFGERRALSALLSDIDVARSAQDGAACIMDADTARIDLAMATAKSVFPIWDATPVDARAAILERAAELIEARRGALIALLQDEGGKTLDDALAEVREATDFCRYYAHEARIVCRPALLPGPTGEENTLRRIGRGVFVCISPWNFPLAIFLGQIAAALATGNSVVAKPAEQTPRVALAAARLLIEAGIPDATLQLVIGAGDTGAALVAHEDTAGVVFTGSVEVARTINRALAAKDGAIVPLIAETGGINALIADSTALVEQLVDDVVVSAFRSAGQRCSALRLLCLQEDIAPDALTMLTGAARELRVGDPSEIGVHVGPVIDSEAKEKLNAYLARRESEGRMIYAGAAPEAGRFVAPHIIRLGRASDLHEEVFGPVLHVVTWRADDFDALVAEILGMGYGLTFGLHTRIESRIRALAARVPAGNIYVNRNMIGAIVGGQPFGGFGLSGTGPKAGGPDYLRRFLRETTLSINTAAAGGDAGLMAMEG